MSKSALFTPDRSKNGYCQYQVWDRDRKRLVSCGFPAHRWTAPHHKGVMLCAEHGAFYADCRAETVAEDVS